MSTRVQKGGPIFRPVAKPRGKSTTGNASRQSSVAAEPRSSAAPSNANHVSSSVPAVSTDMPPPTVIPSTGRSLSRGTEPMSRPSGRSSSTVPATISNVSITSGPSDNPVIISGSHVIPSSGRDIAMPTTHSSIPLSAGQTRSFPIVVTRSSQTPTSQDVNSGSPPNATIISQPQPPNITFNQVLLGQAPNFEPALNLTNGSDVTAGSVASGSELPRVALNTDNTVKVQELRRKSGRKKKGTPSESPPEDDKEIIAPNKPKKITRRKKGEKPGNQSANSTKNQEATADEADLESTGHGVESTGNKRKRRASNATRKTRKPRGSSHPPLDPEADPGEELDPTVVTMATLCSDTGQGRISSKAVQIQTNHAAWKMSNREKRFRMKSLMENKKYGKKEGVEDAASSDQDKGTEGALAEDSSSGNAIAGIAGPSEIGVIRAPSTGPPPQDETGQGFDYSEAMSTSRFNVQVRIGPNGETIIDEESLFVDRNEGEDTATYTHVEESDTTKFTNSATYGKKYRGSRWSAEETELFFNALSQFGENYELISYVLPGRDRKACKNKFKSEDRKDSNRITYCLKNRVPYDMQTLSRMTGKDFSGPTPEIRAPAVLSLADHEKSETSMPIDITRKDSTTPTNDGVEVLGEAAFFEEDHS